MDKNKRPYTTLFLIQSLDGKITTGDNDNMDTDDFHRIKGIKEGISRYYELEKSLDRVYLNSGRVFEKVGFNDKTWDKDHHDGPSFVVVDSQPHLTLKGYAYLAGRCETFFLITNNKNHPAFSLIDKHSNIVPLLYEGEIDFVDTFGKLRQKYGVERMTIQTGGTLNALFLRSGLIDKISLVVAPCLVGGKDTQSLIGGESLHDKQDLTKIKALKLIKSETWENSYLHLKYEVLNETVIENKI
ncbi:deaminase [Candidatus Shapirobacteria bacterium CG09_land_8_20_14_0_10_47_13]|uniref:Deaminase n=1 Tax=Candidatus Shapirobacteria bacterium CG09_land_8_20_14_0_10_47_13 TaxID=1974481 RepID=A0A2H0WMB2_9BACT|nr:MAG: deaminase [Candidatus Shapirobacteria bacterium CG09_land_8_20_14_0_10_47_13]